MDVIEQVLIKYNIVMSFLFVGLIIFIAKRLAGLTKGRVDYTAIAMIMGLTLAYVGGVISGNGKGGLASIPMFSGLAIFGGAMFRDYAIVATAIGARWTEIKKSGLAAIGSLFVGILISYTVGVTIARCFGFTNPVDIATIGAGCVTYIVGPVTGAALGASSTVISLSVAAGVIKSVSTMLLTPIVARQIGLNNPKSAMVFGGLMGTTSGTVAALAAVDRRLVPYGALTANFITGLGCIVCPSLLFLATKMIFH
jgi:malonate transporter MadM subunit